LLSGHIDYGTVLVTRHRTKKEPEFWDRITSFARPFTWQLWLGIFAMIILAGLVSYLTERIATDHVSLSRSIYSYFGGTLWGGFPEATNSLSAIYQISMAFLILVVISSYTANLAAALTISSFTHEPESVAQLMAESLPVCQLSTDPLVNTYRSFYRQLSYDSNAATWGELRRMLLSHTCAAAFAPAITLRTWRSTSAGASCMLKRAEEVLQARSGWITNAHSECVRRGIELGMQELSDDGTVELLLQRWLPPKACSEQDEVEPPFFSPPSNDPTSRRRLEVEENRADGGRVAAGTRKGSRRHLAAKASGGGAAAGGVVAASPDGPGDVEQLTLLDFIGIFVLWGVATAFVLSMRCIQTQCERSTTVSNSVALRRATMKAGSKRDLAEQSLTIAIDKAFGAAGAAGAAIRELQEVGSASPEACREDNNRSSSTLRSMPWKQVMQSNSSNRALAADPAIAATTSAAADEDAAAANEHAGSRESGCV